MRASRSAFVSLAVVMGLAGNLAPPMAKPAACQTGDCLGDDVSAPDGDWKGRYEYRVEGIGDMGGGRLEMSVALIGDLDVQVVQQSLAGEGTARWRARNRLDFGDITAVGDTTQEATGTLELKGPAMKSGLVLAKGQLGPATVVGAAEGLSQTVTIPGGKLDVVFIVRQITCGELSGVVAGSGPQAISDAVQTLTSAAPNISAELWAVELVGRDEMVERSVEEAIAIGRQGEPSDENLRYLARFASELQRRQQPGSGDYFGCLGERVMRAAWALMLRRIERLLQDFPPLTAPTAVLHAALTRLMGEYHYAAIVSLPEECLEAVPGWDKVKDVLREVLFREAEEAADMSTMLRVRRALELMNSWGADADRRWEAAWTRLGLPR
jgi:hypothetical protein